MATPCYDGRLEARYASAMLRSFEHCFANNVRLLPIYLSYDALIQRARNDLIAMAVNGDADDLFWIDSDIEWDPHWILDLLQKPVDVVGAAVVKKTNEGEQYNVRAEPAMLKPDDTGLIPVIGLGTGFLRMSQKAIKHLWDSSPVYKDRGEERRLVSEVRLEDMDLISEDLVMSRKLRSGGFKIYLDPTKTCNHVGATLYRGNFEAFMNALNEAKVD